MSGVAVARVVPAAFAGTDTIEYLLAPLRGLLDDDSVTELVMNEGGVAIIEKGGRWEYAKVPVDVTHVRSLATAVATWTAQGVNEQAPLLGATLASGERVQFVLPPAVEEGRVSLTVRKPARAIFSLDELTAQGVFDGVRVICDSEESVRAHGADLNDDERALLDLLWRERIHEFARQSVTRRATLVVCGATGSGKTTFMKTLMQEVDAEERIVTIEDAREIFLPRHRNVVHLLYSKGGQGTAKVDAQKLLVASLRMRPDRILLAEVREGEAYDFLRVAASGHPGSMTSMHAGSAALAFEQLALMIRQSGAGAGLARSEALHLLRQLVDVVFVYRRQRKADGTVRRHVAEVYYKPLARIGGST